MSNYPRDLMYEMAAPAHYDNDGVDILTTVGRVRRPGVVNSVEIIPNRDMTGADTNSRTYTLYNRGQSGAGTAVVAQLALASGVNLENGVAKTITLGAAADRAVVLGDILEWQSLHVGTGLPDPGGLVVVKQSNGA